eukprot:245909_1
MALIAGAVGVTALLWGWSSDSENQVERQKKEIQRLRKTVNRFNEEYNTFHMKYTQLPQFQFDFIGVLQEHNISDIQQLRSFDNKKLDEIWEKTVNRMYERYYNILKETSPPMCNDKCYDYQELDNNECETDCQCASVRKCIGRKCQGTSTYFNEPVCNAKKTEYIKLLEEYELEHIWPILNNNGYNSTAIILSITQQMLKEINIQTADTLKFDNLQKGLQNQKKSIVSKILNHPITKWCQENTELVSALWAILVGIPIVAKYVNMCKKKVGIKKNAK